MVIIDLEIVKAIRQHDELPKAGVEYCAGWNDHKNMGISVLVAFDYKTQQYHTFLEDNKEEGKKLLQSASCIAGYNIKGFDLKVIEACWELDLFSKPLYDLRDKLCKASHSIFVKGLGDLALHNFQEGKSGDGAMAPVNWQAGKFGTVIDYCIRDVYLTKRLIDLVYKTGGLFDGSKHVLVEKPELPQ